MTIVQKALDFVPDGSHIGLGSVRATQTFIKVLIHRGQGDHLRLPRLPVADSSVDLLPDESQESACARLQEKGATTTPFDMVVLNGMDCFHLCEDVIDRLPQLGDRAAYFKQAIQDKLIEHNQHIGEHGDDIPEIGGWKWGQSGVGPARGTSTEAGNV